MRAFAVSIPNSLWIIRPLEALKEVKERMEWSLGALGDGKEFFVLVEMKGQKG